MEYLMQFHWWYLLLPFVLLILFVMIFGEGKGGIVVKRFTAKLSVIDERFKGCQPEANYSIFKEGQPDRINIEVEELHLSPGEELDFQLNGTSIAIVKVEKDREAEFDHWSDENVTFPVVAESDELVIKYQGFDVLKGIFHLEQ